MSLYEERLSNDLDRLRDETVAMGAAVADAVRYAVNSCFEGDADLANQTIIHDKPINRKRAKIRDLGFAFMAVHSPSAGHLRQVSSIMRLADELERIGDYAETIAREGLQLPHRPKGKIKKEMVIMGKQALDALLQSMAAYRDTDEELARETRRIAKQVKRHEEVVYEELVEVSEKEEIHYLFDMLIIISRLRRISERARNICEEVVFVVTGEIKTPKSFKILFLDPQNNCQSQIAEAVARRYYPNSCAYASAGSTDAADLAPGLIEFMESKGLTSEPVTPKALDPDVLEAGAYAVIVSLKGPLGDYLSEQPYRSAFFEWDVGEAPEDGAKGAKKRYVAMYREITTHIQDLITVLRGEGAD